MNNRFDWSLIPSFLAALERGSLLGAARAMGASQPTLGRHIAELESQLGVALFERTGRGLLPTPMAHTLAEAARSMEAGAFQLSRAALGAAAAEAGTVRLSASQPVCCFVLPPLLAQMRIALPEVQVELVSSNEVANLLRREADIAVRMVEPDQATLVARRIGKVTLGTYAHGDYLRRRGVPREPGDLLAHDLIGGDRNEDIIRGFSQLGQAMARESFVLRTDDLVAYWQAVRAGVGIGFVADYLARTDRAVVPLLPMLKIPPLPMWLVVHREIRGNARIRAVYDFLARSLPKGI
ncbi:MAG: LysR family transcriptional regulator [Pseudomonadota bacterium]